MEVKFGKRELLIALAFSAMYPILIFIFKPSNLLISDLMFLYRRARAMVWCIQDGNPPWYFYKHMTGYGYGCSFFYGQLTLYPFLPLVALFRQEVFILAYMWAAGVSAFVGAWCVGKRLCSSPLTVAIVTVGGVFESTIFLATGMQCFLLGQGLGLIFLAYSYDFFAHRKNGVKAALVFFMVLGTNLMATLLSFVFCVVLCVLYFNPKRIKDYFWFLGLNLLICSYPLANFFYHYPDSTRQMDFATIGYATGSSASFPTLCADFIPFRITSQWYALLEPVSFMLLLYGWKKSKTLRGHLVFGVLFIYNMVANELVWSSFNIGTKLIYQFPFRPVLFMLVPAVAIASRAWGKKIKLYTCLISIFCVLAMCYKIIPYNLSDLDRHECFLDCINGEFLGSDAFLPDDYGRFHYENEKCVGYSKEGETILRLPRYWYRGYKAFTVDGRELPCMRGKNMIVEVNATGYVGDFYVKYVHPYWLRFLGLFDYLIWSILFIEFFILRRIGRGHYWKRSNGSR